MTERPTTGAPGAFVPGASGLPRLDGPGRRAWLHEQADALDIEPGTDVPVFGTRAWEQAPEAIQRASALRFAAARYEDDTELAERLRRDVENMRAAYLADQADQIDQLQALVRDDRKALGKLPTFEELRARRRTYPPTRPMIQTPGWPAPVIPGSGGRRLGEPNEGAA